MRASILITNYNKEKYLSECINSCIKQTYKDIEVIICDDASTDGSLNIINNYKNRIKIIKNSKKKFQYPSLNQIYCLKKCFNISTGQILFLLDADDYFNINKIKKVISFFKKNKQVKFAQDTPTLLLKNQQKINSRIKEKNNKDIWPYFFSTSTMVLKRDAFKKFLRFDSEKKFFLLEIDARIAIFANFYLNNFNIIKEHLTIYRKLEDGISSITKKFSRLWWLKRYQAHKYLEKCLKYKNISYKYNFDYTFTIFINKLLNRKLLKI